jgi:hypothetical protein
MLVRSSDYTRPTDGPLAFALLPLGEGPAPGAAVPPAGTRTDIRLVAQEVLGAEAAARFAARVQRWGGPEDARAGAEGAPVQPYAAEQLLFEERGWPARLTPADVEAALEGRVLVLRGPVGRTDYVLRDHHMVDVALYHYRTTGELPRGGLFHADRHSDWCSDSFLRARVPQQAATWWALLDGLKRPGGSAPVVDERHVVFTTAQAARREGMSGRDVGAAVRVPPCVDPSETGWAQVLAREGALAADWVSLDLDYFQPAPQLALTAGLLRAPAFQALLARARVRVFCLSPQFTNGGDRIEPWVVQGSRASSLRLLNLLRADDLPARAPPR